MFKSTHQPKAPRAAKFLEPKFPVSGSPSTVLKRRVLIENDGRQYLFVIYFNLLNCNICIRGVQTARAHFKSFLLAGSVGGGRTQDGSALYHYRPTMALEYNDERIRHGDCRGGWYVFLCYSAFRGSRPVARVGSGNEGNMSGRLVPGPPASDPLGPGRFEGSGPVTNTRPHPTRPVGFDPKRQHA